MRKRHEGEMHEMHRWVKPHHTCLYAQVGQTSPYLFILLCIIISLFFEQRTPNNHAHVLMQGTGTEVQFDTDAMILGPLASETNFSSCRGQNVCILSDVFL